SLGDVGAEITAFDVDVSPAIEASVFALQHGWAIDHCYLSHGPQGDVGAGWRHDGQLPDVGHRIAHLAWVTQVDRIALQSFDRLGDVHAADRGSDHLLHINNVEPKACSGFAVDIDIDISPPR